MSRFERQRVKDVPFEFTKMSDGVEAEFAAKLAEYHRREPLCPKCGVRTALYHPDAERVEDAGRAIVVSPHRLLVRRYRCPTAGCRWMASAAVEMTAEMADRIREVYVMPPDALTQEQRQSVIDAVKRSYIGVQVDPPLMLDGMITDVKMVVNRPREINMDGVDGGRVFDGRNVYTVGEPVAVPTVVTTEPKPETPAGNVKPLGVNWTAEDVAKCLTIFWNLGLSLPNDPAQRMEQDGPTVTLLDSGGKPQRFRLVREYPTTGSDS